MLFPHDHSEPPAPLCGPCVRPFSALWAGIYGCLQAKIWPKTCSFFCKFMKPNNKTVTKIKLSKTFFNIASGEASASDVAAKKKADREAAKAEAKQKGKPFDATDPF